MSPNIGYFILGVLGLSFLVFIHELGHYFAARRVGVGVEVFSIGLGKPLYVWYRKGVKWQICLILFGGYIKMVGEEGDSKGNPHVPGISKNSNDFYNKSVWQKIFIVIMGPLVNIVFAFIMFSAIYVMGGRMKIFEEYTHMIGWVDPASELKQNGVHPGDTISSYNGRPFTGFHDLLFNGVLKENQIEIAGDKVNYYANTVVPYAYKLTPYQMSGMPKELRTVGVLSPASLMVFKKFDTVNGVHSPLFQTGIQEGDRFIWANGELLFSLIQLSRIVNQDAAYLTVMRNHEILHIRVPRLLVGDVQLDQEMHDEIIDWRRSLEITAPVESLYFMPYQIDGDCIVRGEAPLIDTDLFEEQAKTRYQVAGLDEPLQVGDQIVAVNGALVSDGIGLFKEMMEKKILLMVQNQGAAPLQMTWENQDRIFRDSVDWKNVGAIAAAIGTKEAIANVGELRLLKPITPITLDAFKSRSANLVRGSRDFVLQALPGVEIKEYISVGAEITTEKVHYNPLPTTTFNHAVKETWITFYALATGSLSPKWLAGPIGMVKVMHDSLSVSIKDAFYWLGLISLNLGLINLVPIPVLDGGRICIFIYEGITRRRVSNKAMEQLLLPFVVLLIMLFIYVTYQDISKLLS